MSRKFDVVEDSVNSAAAYKLRSIKRKLERQKEVREQILSAILFLAIVLGGAAVAVFCSDSIGDYAEAEEATVQVQNGSYAYDENGYEQYLAEKAETEAEEAAHWSYLNNGGDHAD